MSSTGSAESSTSTYLNLEQWYHYQPNEGLAIAALIIFAVLCLILLAQCVYYRCRYTLSLPLAALGEVIGYLTRYLIIQGASKTVFIISLLFLLITPNIFALCNYSTMGHLLARLQVSPRATSTWLRVPIITDATGVLIPSRIATFFFLSDIISLVVQAASASFLSSSNPTDVQTGQDIVEAGLAWALAFIALFFCVTIYVYLSPTYQLRQHPQRGEIRRIYVPLFVTITLLLTRSIYRMIEFATGQTGYLNTHEGWFYGFDSLLMICACICYIAFPFAKYIPQIQPAAGPGTPTDRKVINVEMGESGKGDTDEGEMATVVRAPRNMGKGISGGRAKGGDVAPSADN